MRELDTPAVIVEAAPAAAPGPVTATPSEPDTATPSGPVTAMLAMLDIVSPLGNVELERVLSSKLAVPPPTPAEYRVGQLYALTLALNSELAVSLPAHPLAPVQVSQVDYDSTRPAGAPSSATLVNQFGGADGHGWSWACRAAWGLLPDGRKTTPGSAWANGLRGKHRVPACERDHVIASIRACAHALLRRPSSYMYVEWVSAQRRQAIRAPGGGGTRDRKRGPRNLVGIAGVYQHFPRGWTSALAAANTTDAELDAQRTTLVAERAGDDPAFHPQFPTPAERLTALSDDELNELGLDVPGLTPAKRDRLVRNGCGELQLLHAATLARALEGSLDWLAGRDRDPGQPPAATVHLDADKLRALAKTEGVRLDALARGAKLDVSSWRAVMNGKREPTLGQLANLASPVWRAVADLCAG